MLSVFPGENYLDTAGTLLLYYVYRMRKQIRKSEENMKNLINSINAIDNMADLNVVIRTIKAKQKALKAELCSIKRSELSVGDTVNISTKTGNRVGVITKVNRSRCDVTIKGTSYTVPMSIMEVA